MRCPKVARVLGALVMCVMMLVTAECSYALELVDIVGIEDWEDGDAVEPTLTGGFIDTDWQWSHQYGAVSELDIISATITIDIIDPDTGHLALSAIESGTSLGSITGGDSGTPGPWRALGDSLIWETTLPLPSSVYADLADGTFAVYGTNTNDLGIWGSNRSRLVIELVPEPGTLGLLLIGGLALLRKRV